MKSHATKILMMFSATRKLEQVFITHVYRKADKCSDNLIFKIISKYDGE